MKSNLSNIIEWYNKWNLYFDSKEEYISAFYLLLRNHSNFDCMRFSNMINHELSPINDLFEPYKKQYIKRFLENYYILWNKSINHFRFTLRNTIDSHSLVYFFKNICYDYEKIEKILLEQKHNFEPRLQTIIEEEIKNIIP
jgi:hypothetical protein